MRLERAVRFGFIGAVGVTAISAGTSWLVQQGMNQSMTVFNQLFIYLVVGGVGTALALTFLFGLIDVFVDEKLEEWRQSGAGNVTGSNAPGDD